MKQLPRTTPDPARRAGSGSDGGARELLTYARECRVAADRAEADLLGAAAAWAALHPAGSLVEAATVVEAFGDTGIALGGPGCPLVAEFAVPEFAAAVGLTPAAGRNLVAEALELVHRLPRLWARVEAGGVSAWRARLVARHTMALSVEAAGFVDAQVGGVAGRVRTGQLERLVAEAMARFMPAAAERRRRERWEGRHVCIEHQQISFEGTSRVHAELDLADALDLEEAIAHRAAELKHLGSADSLDGRRATALGDLARGQGTLALWKSTHAAQRTGATVTTPRREPARRELVLHVHLSEHALTCGSGASCGESCGRGGVARLEAGDRLVTVDQVRAWCGHPGTRVTVRPVLDLEDSIRTDAYEIPDRLRAQVIARDGGCVFPWCGRPARVCDLDHVRPWPAGTTESANLAPLCRRHHRLKTHAPPGTRWTYAVLAPGTYVWTSPHGLRFLRDHTGTTDATGTDWPHPAGPAGIRAESAEPPDE